MEQYLYHHGVLGQKWGLEDSRIKTGLSHRKESKDSKQLKRKLNNSEWVTIERRKGSGETLAEILNDMNVLKR